MNADRFPLCLQETLRWEGGWSNHPADPGGATMKGVTQRVYNGWRDGKALPRRNVKFIEAAEIEDVYRGSYWNAVRGGELPPGVDLVVWDAAVNSGPVRAIKWLQKVTNVTCDGHIGAATIAAVGRFDEAELVTKYMSERSQYLRNLPTFPTFGKGWMNRCEAIKAKALVMAGESRLDMAPPPVPLADPDKQSETQGKAIAEDPKPPVMTEFALLGSGIASNVTGFANGFAKLQQMPEPSIYQVAMAFLSEPLVLTGIVPIFGFFLTRMWRRQFQ